VSVVGYALRERHARSNRAKRRALAAALAAAVLATMSTPTPAVAPAGVRSSYVDRSCTEVLLGGRWTDARR
jgi:hypothetical protein